MSHLLPGALLFLALVSTSFALEPYETFCTSESDFKADAPLFQTCNGTDIQACKDAGGTYVEEDGICDDIDTDTSEACENITGYSYEVPTTCEQYGTVLDMFVSSGQFTNCTDAVGLGYKVPQFQLGCCGGASYSTDVCSGSNTYEAFCTSESDFKADAPFLYGCYGTDTQACEDAGGTYDEENGKCNGNFNPFKPDSCENIAGYSSEVEYTCEQYGTILAVPDNLERLTDCTTGQTLAFLPLIQDPCCGGASYNKNICPDTITTTTAADVCSKCDKNREEIGVSTDCFAAVLVWEIISNESFDLDVCSETNGPDVSVECKALILETLDCMEGGNSSGEDDLDGEVSSASDFSKMVAMLFTALVMCWTHFV